ncbi:MAG: SulP family inorganic anion transporter [Nannocystaceae bacterium]
MFTSKNRHLVGDIFGGLTAGVVALPLALAFGITSGLPADIAAVAGLYGAIAVGVLAAAFGGTPTQVSGPTGPMTVVAAAVVATAKAHGAEIDLGFVFGTFALAGLIQIGMGAARMGVFIRYIPHSVVSGFMSGIGVIILLLQVFPMLGRASPSSPLAVLQRMPEVLSQPDTLALLVTAITVAIIFAVPRWTTKVPGPLVALIVVTAGVSLASLDVAVIGAIPTGMPALHLTVPSLGDLELMLPAALSLAALGAIDSLLTSVVADNITRTRHDPNRELIGQGIGNFVGGVIGGLPGAGATMRTVVNVRSGGRTRLSGIIHGALLLAILLGLGPLAALIPKPVLAGILVTVGIGIIDYKSLKQLKRMPRVDAVVLVSVLFLTVFVDLLWAVAVGVMISGVAFIQRMSTMVAESALVVPLSQSRRDSNDGATILGADLGEQIYVKELDGPLFFGVATQLVSLTEKVPTTVTDVIIRMERVPYIDQSGLVALDETISRLLDRNIRVALAGLSEQPRNLLELLHVVPEQVPPSLVFPSFDLAIEAILKTTKATPIHSNQAAEETAEANA